MKSKEDVVHELQEELRKSSRDCITVGWDEFYELCERKKMRKRFQDEVAGLAKSRYQLVVHYGDNAVIVCHDRNFNPVK